MGDDSSFPGAFPFQGQQRAVTKPEMPRMGPGNGSRALEGAWSGDGGCGQGPAALAVPWVSPALPSGSGSWGWGAVGCSGPRGDDRSPSGAGSRVLCEAPRRPLPRRGRDKGKGSTDLGRRVNTGCWLLPAPRFPPPPAAGAAGGPSRATLSPLSLAAGHRGGGWQRTPHVLVPGGSHLFTRPVAGSHPAAPGARCWHRGCRVYH